MAYETAVLKQLEAYTAKHLSRMGGVSPHIRLTDYRLICNVTDKYDIIYFVYQLLEKKKNGDSFRTS
jgi:hypothetical protein